MKCTNCGADIPEGHMYCDACGREVHMVPEFEPEIENEIHRSLRGVGKHISGKEEERIRKKGSLRLQIKEHPLRLLMSAVVLVLIVFTVWFEKTSSERDLKRAEILRTEGRLKEFIALLKKTMEKEPTNATVILTLASDQREASDDTGALVTLDKIINSARFSEAETVEAYRMTADIYRKREDFDSLQNLLDRCPDTEVVKEYSNDLVQKPVIVPAGGTFSEAQKVTIHAGPGDVIYYTLDGSKPSAHSNQYQEPISLSKSGDILLRAIAISAKGAKSKVSEAGFQLHLQDVPPPQILEESGIYSEPTKIVAIAQAGCIIHYTSDGTRPSVKSKIYTTPVEMPYGDSVFRFFAVDDKGKQSEVITKRYKLVLKPQVSKEQAVSALINALIRNEVLLDAGGKKADEEGFFTYEVDGNFTVQDSDEYYRIVEYHVYDDGHTEKSGLEFSVNVNDGTCYRLGYDSTGKIVLVQLK